MNDNIVAFPGVDVPGGDKAKFTPEEVLHAAHDCYDEIILIGRTKGGEQVRVHLHDRHPGDIVVPYHEDSASVEHVP